MIQLDMRTVMLGYMLSNTICLAVIASLWSANRARYKGMGFWLADFIMQLLAVVIVALRGPIPETFSVLLGTPLIIAGTFLLFLGLERYCDKESTRWPNYLFLAIFFSIHLYYMFAQPSLHARTINFSLALLILCVECAWLLLYRVGAEMRSETRYVGAVFIAFSLFNALRIYGHVTLSHGSSFLAAPPYDVLVMLTFQMLFIALTFSLFLMVNHRLVYALESDITERKLIEEKILHLANHDALTGLATLRLANDRLHSALAMARRNKKMAAMMFIDLDDFKGINDTYGHKIGDEFLKKVAARLVSCVRETDTVARLGGDEFLVILTDVATAQNAAEVAEKLGKAVSKAAAIEKNEMRVEISIGIALYPADGDDFDSLVKEADQAMYSAKNSGKNKFAFAGSKG